MSKIYLNELNDIKAMANKIRSINETIQFGEDYDGEYDDFDDADEESFEQGEELSKMPMDDEPKTEEEEIEDELEDSNSAVNKIREIALKGMVRLCHHTEDPEYEVLKKVFSLIDKANDKKNEEEQNIKR